MRTRDESKEAAIRKKAIEMIVKEGFDGLSMQKLAKAAGVSPATIYIYFKDREDLIYQISIDEGKKLIDATLKDFDPQMNFSDGLRRQWLNRANYFLRNPLQMHFMEQIRYSPFYAKVYKDNGFLSAMRDFVSNAIKRKELVQLPIEVYWSIAFAPLYQLVKFHISPKAMMGKESKFVFDEKMMDLTLNLVLKALKP